MYSTIKILNICRLNRSSKVCLKRVPLATRVHRQAHFPNPNFFSNVYCPVATRFQNPSSWAHSKFWTGPFDLVLFYYYLMNIVAALPAARSSSPLIAAEQSFFYNHSLLLDPLWSIPQFLSRYRNVLLRGDFYAHRRWH